jgi:hypothetical protein
MRGFGLRRHDHDQAALAMRYHVRDLRRLSILMIRAAASLTLYVVIALLILARCAS